MAEFQGIFCCPFLPSVLIIEEGVDGMGGRVGWRVMGRGGRGGRWQKLPPGTLHEQP